MGKKYSDLYFQQLAEKWLNGTILPEEKQILETWFNTISDEPVEISSSTERNETAHARRLFENIKRQIADRENRIKAGIPYRWKRTWIAAASIVVLLVVSYTIYKTSRDEIVLNPRDIANIQQIPIDIAPGSNSATLFLSDGREVSLNSLKEGEVIKQGSVAIMKINGALKYIGKTDAIVYNTIKTKRGNQWKMALPDGTLVWLNAESSLTYPISFTKGERVVELKGEGYFDVTHKFGQPFKVKTGDQVIEDIGTAFNVNAYGNNTTATLVKGAIKVRDKVLKPGQQASIKNDKVIIKNVDIEDVIAWTNGQFSMDDISLEELMKQISRWYDVEVEFRGSHPQGSFGGLIDRNVPLSNIISVLNANGITAKIEKGKIIISSQ